LLDKGVRIANVPEILGELKRQHIGCQLMGFTGFPGERKDEEAETYAFLDQHRQLWALAGIGEFLLTPGSIVAKQAARFGVAEQGPYRGDDIPRYLWFTDETKPLRRAREIVKPLGLDGSVIAVEGNRPFVGGIDSAHSLLYFARFGGSLLPETRTAAASIAVTYPNGIPVEELTSAADVAALHQYHQARRRSAGWTEMFDWLAEELPDSGRRVDLAVLEDGEIVAEPAAAPLFRVAVRATPDFTDKRGRTRGEPADHQLNVVEGRTGQHDWHEE